MNASPKCTISIISFNIFYTCSCQHFNRIIFHIHTHFLFIFLIFDIHRKDIQSPFILFCFIKGDFIFMIRKCFSKSANMQCPGTRFG